jgi:predicted nucleic acid-binding protein
MIAVDSSVWIELLRGTGSAHDERLRFLIADDAPLALTPITLTEVLQGVPDEAQAELLANRLLGFQIIELDSPGDFVVAAQLYRRARSAGLTIRRTLDCLIAAPCVRLGIPLLHNDRDFDRLASCTDLAIA